MQGPACRGRSCRFGSTSSIHSHSHLQCSGSPVGSSMPSPSQSCAGTRWDTEEGRLCEFQWTGPLKRCCSRSGWLLLTPVRLSLHFPPQLTPNKLKNLSRYLKSLLHTLSCHSILWLHIFVFEKKKAKLSKTCVGNKVLCSKTHSLRLYFNFLNGDHKLPTTAFSEFNCEEN